MSAGIMKSLVVGGSSPSSSVNWLGGAQYCGVGFPQAHGGASAQAGVAESAAAASSDATEFRSIRIESKYVEAFTGEVPDCNASVSFRNLLAVTVIRIFPPPRLIIPGRLGVLKPEL